MKAPKMEEFERLLKKDIVNSENDNNPFFIRKVSNQPTIDLRFLHQSPNCLNYAMIQMRKDSNDDKKAFIDSFEEFIYNFSSMNSLSDAVNAYSSHINRKKLKPSEYKTLIDCLPNDVQQIAQDELIHLHLKRGGKGKSILIGFCLNEIFFVLAIDPKHELIPCS